MDSYLSFLATNRKSVNDARHRAEAFILPELGKIEVERLTTERLTKWHADLAALPARAWTKSPRHYQGSRRLAPPPGIGEPGANHPAGGAIACMA